MTERGLISVITATYNMAEHIAETMTSILAQEYANLEAIVVDDGSTDNTAEVLEPFLADPRVRVVRQENAGQTVAKNRGIAEARGEFVAFCDADDTWRSDKLAKQIPLFDDPEVAVVFSDIHWIDGEGQIIETQHYQRKDGKITGKLLEDNFIPFPTSVVRASVLEEMEGFDESLSMSIDYDLWLRISVKYRFGYVAEPLANYRIWPGQMSSRTGERLDNFFTLLERFLEKYPDSVTEAEKNHAWAHVLTTRGVWHYSEGRRKEAWRDYYAALSIKWLDFRLWICIVNWFLGRVPRL